MELVLLEQAKKDIEYWKKSGNQKVQKRISSRRITKEHRMVYSVSDGFLYIYVFSLRYHYEK